MTTIQSADMVTAPERFDDCRAFNPFAIVDQARKHGGGRHADVTIREKLVALIKSMSPDGSALIQADVLAAATAADIASTATLRSIMLECAEQAGVKVEIVRGRRGPRGPMGQRDETIIRERLLREKLEEVKEQNPEGISRPDLENILFHEGFNASFIRAGVSPVAKEIGLIIHDRTAGRKVDMHRIEVTRMALKAAAAAGLKTRPALIATVLRFWQVHAVECAHTESAAYRIIQIVRNMDAPKVEEPAQVEQVQEVAQVAETPVSEPAPF